MWIEFNVWIQNLLLVKSKASSLWFCCFSTKQKKYGLENYLSGCCQNERVVGEMTWKQICYVLFDCLPFDYTPLDFYIIDLLIWIMWTLFRWSTCHIKDFCNCIWFRCSAQLWMKLKQYPPQYVLFLGCSIISVGVKLKFEEELIMMLVTYLVG